MNEPLLAIIGGSGVASVAGFLPHESLDVDTPWGAPSAAIRVGVLQNRRALFLPRHGSPHAIAPHRINYRANVWALRELGASCVLAINAVGGIAREAAPGRLLVPRQIIDYTYGRASSFHDGTVLPLQHQEFTEPYDPGLREMLVLAASDAGVVVHPDGVYGCTQGPRLETAAEIMRMQRDGCDMVGMTAMPEAVLAIEIGLRYASLAMVVNRAAGKSVEPITPEHIDKVAEQCMSRVAAVIGACAVRVARDTPASA